MGPVKMMRKHSRHACWLIALGSVVVSISTHAADCDTELKSTDGFKDLSVKLRCLHDRIKALEGSTGAGAPSAASLAKAASPRVRTLQNGIFQVELKKCAWSQSNSDLYCDFEFTNLTTDDKKLCLGEKSRLVTDSGASFSSSNGINYGVGSINGSVWPGNNPICDTITPLSKIGTWIRFNGSKGAASSELQFLRLDCGAGCVFEVHRIEIK